MSSLYIESGKDWTFDDIYKMYDEIEKIGVKEMGYNIYPNQIEIITSEQMLDAYARIGMPIFYNHWSFGKRFVKDRDLYNSGRQGLAYEIVINSNPCIVYCMEQNTLLMQALVIAHAGIGHNHFFKNNQLFTDWTQPSYIIEYLEFAKKYVNNCEEKYGIREVEKILDAAHALMNVGVFRYPHKEKLTFQKEMERKINKALEEERSFNDLWRTLPKKHEKSISKDYNELKKRQEKFKLPEENLLYFLETYSPILKNWQKEILRIVRNIAQYFYPQSQDSVMNEGCATWTHYTILNKLYEKNMLSDGAMVEFLKSHTGVTYQPSYDKIYYSGINPYALGFSMMEDICRICDNPTEEDKIWFPAIAGCKDHLNVLKDIWENYRDESFIRQFLSPKIMRDFKFFSLAYNEQKNDRYLVTNIHNEKGYRNIRTILADAYTLSNSLPNVEIWDVNLAGNRELQLRYNMYNGKMLNEKDAKDTLKHIVNLWGYPVQLITNDEKHFTQANYFQAPEIESNENLSDENYYCC